MWPICRSWTVPRAPAYVPVPPVIAQSCRVSARMSIEVLIADDQELVRTGLRMILDAQEDIEVVGEAEDGEQAVKAAQRLRPDVVVMDVRMPRMDGLQATRRIVAEARRPPRVLVLTTFDLDEYVYAALRAGASGFLLKGAPTAQMVDAVRVVASGDAMISPSVTKRLIDEFAKRPDTEGLRRPSSTSSPRASAKCSS